jgi:hypothetical protein
LLYFAIGNTGATKETHRNSARERYKTMGTIKRFEIGLVIETEYEETEEGVVKLLEFLATCTPSRVRFIIHDVIEQEV